MKAEAIKMYIHMYLAVSVVWVCVLFIFKDLKSLFIFNQYYCGFCCFAVVLVSFEGKFLKVLEGGVIGDFWMEIPTPNILQSWLLKF